MENHSKSLILRDFPTSVEEKSEVRFWGIMTVIYNLVTYIFLASYYYILMFHFSTGMTEELII